MNKDSNTYIIVESGNKQMVCYANKPFLVDKLICEGDTVNLKRVFDGTNVVNDTVSCKVLNEIVKGTKVIIYKTRRRKGYERKNGFRSRLTELIWGGN